MTQKIKIVMCNQINNLMVNAPNQQKLIVSVVGLFFKVTFSTSVDKLKLWSNLKNHE